MDLPTNSIDRIVTDYPDMALRKRHHILVLFWALLFAKCFILEYCVVAYAVPINSVTYVWSLSLFMATIASIVYVDLIRREHGEFKVYSRSGQVWMVCIAITVVTALTSFAFAWITIKHLLGIIALVLAVGYGVQYFYRREPPALCCTVGWCLCAFLLLQIEHPYSLLVFGTCLIAFAAFPSFLIYLRLRQQTV
ncbi:MAG: hypothetical protein AAF065_05115 [Verrucomicrobiota bacterium]